MNWDHVFAKGHSFQLMSIYRLLQRTRRAREIPIQFIEGTYLASKVGIDKTYARDVAEFARDAWLIQARTTAHAARRLFYSAQVAKRVFDLAVGIPLLVASLPVILALAVLVRLDSPGPILFRQPRVGEGGKQFTFYKFRTMYADARQRFPELYAYRYSPAEIRQMYFKLIDDPRLTPLGRRLRRTSLDELPNLFNVVRGEMSLVGPRPELPEMVQYYRESQLPKFSVKPGVTGLAQVTGRGILRFQETIAADLEYIERRSLWFDLAIVIRTVDAIVRRVGAF